MTHQLDEVYFIARAILDNRIKSMCNGEKDRVLNSFSDAVNLSLDKGSLNDTVKRLADSLSLNNLITRYMYDKFGVGIQISTHEMIERGNGRHVYFTFDSTGVDEQTRQRLSLEEGSVFIEMTNQNRYAYSFLLSNITTVASMHPPSLSSSSEEEDSPMQERRKISKKSTEQFDCPLCAIRRLATNSPIGNEKRVIEPYVINQKFTDKDSIKNNIEQMVALGTRTGGNMPLDLQIIKVLNLLVGVEPATTCATTASDSPSNL